MRGRSRVNTVVDTDPVMATIDRFAERILLNQEMPGRACDCPDVV